MHARISQVEILAEGDSVNELMLLVGGMVEVLRPGDGDKEELTIDVDGHSSVRGGYYNRCAALQILLTASENGVVHVLCTAVQCNCSLLVCALHGIASLLPF